MRLLSLPLFLNLTHMTKKVGSMNTDDRKLYRMVRAVIPPNCCKGGMVAKTKMPNPVTVVMVVPNSAVPV